MHGLLRRDAKNRKMILCYTLSPLSAQNLFFCGFHLDGLFNVQCCNPPRPRSPSPSSVNHEVEKGKYLLMKMHLEKRRNQQNGG